MKKISLTLKRKVLVIELPKGTKSHQYNDAFETIYAEVPNDKGVSFEQIKIEKGYTLLGSPDDLKEEDVKDLVETDEVGDVEDFRYQKIFIDYNDEENAFTTALESFNSALEKEIYWVNPFLDSTDAEDLDKHLHDWMEAEQNTFDRTRTLIFVEN